MIRRDRIVVRYKNEDDDPVEKVVRGVVVTDEIDANLPAVEPFGGKLRFRSFFRVILPHTVGNLSAARDLALSFGSYTGVRPETGVAPIFDGRGRVHHYEAIIRSTPLQR